MTATDDGQGRRRTAVITGAGTGIGRATAVVLAEAGMRCVLVGRTAATLEQTAGEIAAGGGDAIACVADVTTDAGRRAAVAACGRVDVLVNNATVTALEPLLDYAERSWREVLAVNLDACFFLAQAAIPGMRERGWGRIVNVGSVYGQVALDNRVYRELLAEDAGGRGPVREVAYAAAKGAVRQLTRELAVGVAPWGVTVNSVVPGMIPPSADAIPDAMRARMLERIPVGRFGRPREIAHAIEFLASDRAAYVTGTELVVDGGWVAW